MYIGIDLGATNVRISGLESLDDVVIDDVQRFQLSHNFEDDFGKIIEAIKNKAPQRVEAIGIGTPGTYSEDKKLLTSAKNLPEWISMAFVERLSKEFSCIVLADNDAVVGSLGEASYGQGKNKDFIYITWGSGVGGAQVKIEDGKIYSEKIPWQTYLKDFNLKCGGMDIAKRFGKNAEDLDNRQWEEIMNDFKFYLTYLSGELGGRSIIIGGGIIARQKDRLKDVIDNLAENNIDLKISTLGDDVGLYGAMALIKSKI